ncbi:LacI family transcriptional regulator, repressor for deo operon, udp, cdd, tsx, nupC, and nupG [Ferrithrix thermotolerans DSM 19514]|uniref:LacI family transcriptional regulator, repressor for deo operon, udp, cdd, tsx, nupC, and nupG n=2 Tax=Ferrithrix TaxID=643949 RepID=A0A1M4V073_9ACTN|nr:LacI family transcriptional regulator, repressor for deo operon, udp, cdd, tsx, nupC, and nupG [Ferrithrix thermotolerans DSM 19514]
MERQRVSIFDVARAAGVGVATVSRVLNSSPRVSPTTRARVEAAIEELGYHPSRLASGLSKGRQDMIAVLVPFITRPSVVSRLEGVIEVLDKSGYGTTLYSVASLSQRDRHLEYLMDRHASVGVIVISIPLSREHIASFRANGVQLSLIDTAGEDVPHVVVDDRVGGALAGMHLIGLGHRRIGFIGDEDLSGLGFASSYKRLTGLEDALVSFGRSLDRELIRLGPHGATTAKEMADDLLRLGNPPTAIFAASDTQALGVLRSAQANGLKVPDDLAVIGFDNLEVASIFNLSTIAQPLFESGVEGAQRLLCQLEGREVEQVKKVLRLELHARATTIRSAVGPMGTGLQRQLSAYV